MIHPNKYYRFWTLHGEHILSSRVSDPWNVYYGMEDPVWSTWIGFETLGVC